MSQTMSELARARSTELPADPEAAKPTLSTGDAEGVPEDTQLTPVASAMALIADELGEVEEALGELLHSTVAIIPSVGGHLTFAGGKRFRPMVTLLAAQAAGYDSPKRITVAAAAELLHTATLLHDDVIDEGEYRRGRPAARLHYGNGLAVLTGDYCLARALQAVAYLGEREAVQSMGDAVTRMAEGEVAQLYVAGEWDLDAERYYMVIDRKTAALIAWCSSVARLIPADQADALARYGRELGYAFQIADDIIDYSLDVQRSGKVRGQDLREGKVTLPLLLAVERDAALRGRLEAMLRAGPPADEDELAELLEGVCDAGGLEGARERASAHVETAVAALHALPSSPARDALEELARYVVRRTA
ncbi:polyprenyl synthetase family protein [Pseudenhygromyxa sp. WMMC2535]|uniref:polyprenyl synthetase family protein n=1 Tax=Pseudenhygromyxa sp. WMMC2535 TaxID=2712867 RepID=UPI00159516C9|nr:polyprenyl synthetase family protein [Pseudenhygromyxa sp. WMMC2535]NVB41792.1 polyprenyl synthetase family protein [Pseudenhygromyxa sp. WMMC2535]